MTNVSKLAQNIEEKIINWRRDLHQIPELGLKLPKTTHYIKTELETMGLEVKEVINSGLTATIKPTTSSDKTFAIRADMDGLPIKEQTNLPFASQHEGKMHACGHDAHLAMALGTAKILVHNKDKLAGSVKFIFQPGEEGYGGAQPMIAAGVLDNVNAITGLHIGTLLGPEIPNGTLGISSGPTMACSDKFSITITGQGGHGAMPETTVDPVVTAASIIQELQTLISRELAPTHPGVLTVGQIESGSAYNVIPETAHLQGTTRFVHEQDRQYIAGRMEELITQLANSKQAAAEVDYQFGFPPLVNDPEFTEFFTEVANQVINPEEIIEMDKPLMVAEDMTYYLQEVPGTFFFLTSGRKINGQQHPHHHPKFDLAEDVFWRGTALLAETAVEWHKKANR